MKKNEILEIIHIIIIFVMLVIILIQARVIEKRNNMIANNAKSYTEMKVSYDSLKSSCRRHMAKCAFISTDEIKKRRGNVIILYKNNDLNRK